MSAADGVVAPPPRPPIVILVAVTSLGPLALNIFMPSMPGLMRVFDTGYGTIQLTLTLYLGGLAVAQLFYGPLSDRFGRRPLLLSGLGLFLLGSAVCLVAPTISVLIAGRLIQAVGGCAGLVLSRAIIRDLYDRDRAASMLAYVMMAMVVVPMLAPTVGGFLDEWFGWWSVFLLVLVVGAAVAAGAWAILHETLPPEARRPLGGLGAMSTDFRTLLGQRLFVGYAMQVAFSTTVFFSFVGGAPYVMVELMGRSPSQYGLYFVAVSLMFMSGNFTAGRISVRIGVDRMITAGTVVTVAGAALLVLAWATDALTPATLFGSMAVVAFGNGFNLSNGFAGAVSVDARRIGAASGLAGFLQMAVAALASVLGGALLDDTALPLVAVMATSAAVGAAFHWFVVLPVRGRENA
jgi:DHA1 family bicyclomycin/chloramphenicol resistance-like MFS transporter